MNDNEKYFYDGLADIDNELGPWQVKVAKQDLEEELSQQATFEKVSHVLEEPFEVKHEDIHAKSPESEGKTKEASAGCATPGAKIRSGGKGRGLARGGGEGPMGVPPNIANSPNTSPSEMKKILVNKQKMKLQKVAKDMPPFTEQDRPEKVKDIYKALKREHPNMPAETKARIAARQGKPGKQQQGPPYKAPITKTSKVNMEDYKKHLRAVHNPPPEQAGMRTGGPLGGLAGLLGGIALGRKGERKLLKKIPGKKGQVLAGILAGGAPVAGMIAGSTAGTGLGYLGGKGIRGAADALVPTKLPADVAKKSPKEQAAWFQQNRMKTGAEQIIRDRLREGTGTGITQVDNAIDKDSPFPPAPETKTAAVFKSIGFSRGYIDRQAVKDYDAYSRFMNTALRNKRDNAPYGFTAKEVNELTAQYNKLTGSNVPKGEDFNGLRSFLVEAEKREKEREKKYSEDSPVSKEKRYYHFPTIKMSEEEFSQEKDMLLKISVGKGDLANALQFDSAVSTSLEEEEKGKKELFKNKQQSSDSMRVSSENPSDVKVSPMKARDVQTPQATIQAEQ